METKPRTFLFTLPFLFLFSGSVFGDDVQDGINAAKKGDLKTAYKLIAPYTEYKSYNSITFNMGEIYKSGNGASRDYKEAIKWYRLAAEQGHAESQNRLGIAYRKGQGVLQSHKEATKWHRLAAEQGHAESQKRLGMAYRKGEGVLQSHKEATKWLLKSAEQKYVKAQILIRTSYHQWHKQIAEEGDLYAQRFLGASYYLGLGITQDYTKAAKWYKKAAEQEDRVSQNILGAMYEKGKGVSKDFVEAYKWFSLSQETGNRHMHKEKIGKRNMTSTQIAEAQKLAREWTEKYQKK
jgi:TPR repeat protein